MVLLSIALLATLFAFINLMQILWDNNQWRITDNRKKVVTKYALIALGFFSVFYVASFLNITVYGIFLAYFLSSMVYAFYAKVYFEFNAAFIKEA